MKDGPVTWAWGIGFLALGVWGVVVLLLAGPGKDETNALSIVLSVAADRPVR